MQELNRVLDGDNVLMKSSIDVMHHGSHGGALAAPAPASDQHHSALRLGDAWRMSGRARDARVGTVNGMTRMTIMNDERWRRMFTRKRPTPGMPQEQSKSHI